MTWSRIREPFVRKLLNKRTIMVFAATLAVAVPLVIIFIFVPGKRL